MSLLSCPCSVMVSSKFCLKPSNGPCHQKLHKIPAVSVNASGYKHVVTSFWKSKEKTPSYSKMLPLRNKAKPSNEESFDEEEDFIDQEEDFIDLDFSDEDEEDSPWEGALVYKRSAVTTHLEYCTTLERLGLGKLSSEVSRSRASLLGLLVTKFVKDYVDGTPVLVSIDVTKKRRRLRLDGLIRTVITLACNSCGEPAAEDVFSNFSLLLTEDPVEDPELIDMEEIYEEDIVKRSMKKMDIVKRSMKKMDMEGEFDDGDASIDLDDRLHFPPDQKEIDISKHIRDMVHLEIRVDAICSPACKGVCLSCGVNLNSACCSCTQQEKEDTSYGPLGNLREQMQRK